MPRWLVSLVPYRPIMCRQWRLRRDRTGTFLWEAVTDDGTGLYSVDTETGEATLDTGLSKNEQLVTLFKSNEAKDKAPAAINDMALSFTGTACPAGRPHSSPSHRSAYDGLHAVGQCRYDRIY